MTLWIYFTAVLVAPLVYVLIKVLPFLQRTWTSTQALKKFPMEKRHWLLGHLGIHPGPTHEGLILNNTLTAKYPRCYAFFFGPVRPALVLNHPETVKEITKTAEPKPVSGFAGLGTLLYPWIGDGLLLSFGPKWVRNRKLLTPGFHFDVLKPYISVYNTSVEKLMSVFDRDSGPQNSSIDICRPVSLCTLDIILKCAFSTDKDIQNRGQDEPYVKNVTTLSEIISYRAIRPHLYFDCVFYRTKLGKEFKRCCEFSHIFTNSIIEEHRRNLVKNKTKEVEHKRYVDFLDILLLAQDEAGNALPNAEICDEVETFMFEGHDTTSSAITWILYNLARHPDIQHKAREEVDTVLHGRHSECILWDDLSRLEYLTMCIKESLRLHPPVPVVLRETTKPLEIDGTVFPPGTFLDIWIWNVHHNPTVWKDPLMYNPDRFLPENIKHMDSHAFIPFSAGPRNCIGQNFAMHELKVVIARIVQRFEFRLDESKEVKMSPDITLRAKNGIYLSFKSRK